MPYSLKRQIQVRRVLAAAAMAGCMLPAGALSAGGGHHRQPPQASEGLWDGYQAPCQRCDQAWTGYGSEPCGCQPRRRRHPILGLLDSVAGGVEHALGLAARRSAGCDEVACDDGCDAMLQQHLETPLHIVPAPQSVDAAAPKLRAGQPPRPLPFAPEKTPGRVIERVPAPKPLQKASDPFADEQAGNRPINPAISPSAYFE